MLVNLHSFHASLTLILKLEIIILQHFSPNLGVVDVDDINGFVIADIPGLIEGASEGIGLDMNSFVILSEQRLLSIWLMVLL